MSRSSFTFNVQRGLERYEKASQREKLGIIVVTVILVIGAWDQAVHWPLQKQRQALSGQLETQMQETQAAENSLRFMRQQMGESPADKQRRLADMQLQVENQQQQLQANGLGLISPSQMARVLKDVLARSRAVTLIRLETQRPKPWSLLDSAASGQARPMIYQHGIELELEGDYFSLMNYVKQIEQQAPAIYWDELDYQVQTWPSARLLLRVHTLSLQEAVIGA